MAKFDYNRSRATADRLIKKFGQPGVVRRTAASTGGWNRGNANSPQEVVVNFVLLEYSVRERDGTLIEENDQKALISAIGLTDLSTSDRLVISGIERQIVNVNPLSPGGVVVIYEAQVR